MSTGSEHRRRRIRKGRPTWPRTWLIWTAIVVTACVALLTVKPVFRWFKASRAAQLAEAGNNLVGVGKLSEAADKFRAALQLYPVSYPALRGAARLASQVGRPEAIDLWEQVVKSPKATVQDRQDYAEQLLVTGRPRLAATTIDRLLKEHPESRTLELAARYSRSVGDTVKAIQYARLAVKNSPDDKLVLFHLAELLAASSDSSDRREARDTLWRLTDGPDPYRRSAIEALAGAPELSDTERKRALHLLGTLSPNNLRDALLAANLRLELRIDEPDKIYDEVMAHWNRGDASQLVDLGRWLNLHQQPERVLSLFTVDAALKNNQLLLVRLDALATLQRWNDIGTILARSDLTLDPSVLECFRARASQEQSAPLDAEVHWNHAVSLAARDPLKLRFVADFAEKSHASAVALKVYDQLAKFPEHAAFAYRGTERLSARAGDLSVQRAAAERIRSLAGGDPNAKAQLAYVNLLAGRDVDANTVAALTLAQQYPDRLSFRVTAALGFLRQHDAGRALEQFNGPPGAPLIEWNKTPPTWRAVYAATLIANEQSDAARDIIKSIPVDQLSREERALIELK